ncbi:MAG TPA: polyprenyl synthetase family protein [Candidatus Limnocylindrales bacterium]|nr:polyprenyl synthetase family protein [Candidatus Limnocylindrales bacterium]
MISTPDLDALIADTESEILRVIDKVEDARTGELYEMVRYHLGLDRDGTGGARGKRLRPLLGLLAYESIAGDHRAALPGAAAVELGHNFSLVHDDIEDGDVERRHRATLWTVYGIAHAINAGDTLFTLSRLALHRLTELGFTDSKVLALVRLYDETCLALCEGQFMDIWSAEQADRLSVDFYFDMIGRKTAALIAASVQAGAMLATDEESVVEAYRGFGWSLGMAFQLNDDLLGIWGDEAATGKEPSDLARHKKTLPIIYALENAAAADRSRLREILGVEEPSAEQVEEARRILERSGARDYTRARARAEREEALSRLEATGVVQGEALTRLRLLVASAINA